MTVELPLGWWMLPLATAILTAAWVCWPRPKEWVVTSDYSPPGAYFYGPVRIFVAVVLTLIAVIVWRW